jgi:hypothetical protein
MGVLLNIYLHTYSRGYIKLNCSKLNQNHNISLCKAHQAIFVMHHAYCSTVSNDIYLCFNSRISTAQYRRLRLYSHQHSYIHHTTYWHWYNMNKLIVYMTNV